MNEIINECHYTQLAGKWFLSYNDSHDGLFE